MCAYQELFELPTRQTDTYIKDCQVCPLQKKSWVALKNVQWSVIKCCSILASIAVDIMFNNKPPPFLLLSFSLYKTLAHAILETKLMDILGS